MSGDANFPKPDLSVTTQQNPQPHQEFRIDILVLVLAVIAIGYSLGRYFSDRSNYNQGHQAYQRLDCSVATDYFERVINRWRIIDFGGYATLAQQQKSECLDFKPAFDQQERGNIGQAIVDYNNFLNHHNTDSYLVNTVRDRLNSFFEKNKLAQILGIKNQIPNLKDQKS
jgi:hypothetical protein